MTAATRTRSEIGKANNRKGKDRERRVARYLREHGWPFAERRQRTGFATADRTRADQGDLMGTPGIVWQVKDTAQHNIPAWLEQTEDQRLAAGAQFGVLVVRRNGKADPGQWWAWLPAVALFEGLAEMSFPALNRPICLELGHLVPLLYTVVGHRADSEEAIPTEDLTPIEVGQIWSAPDGRCVRVVSVDPDINHSFLIGPKAEVVNVVTGRRSTPKATTMRTFYRLHEDQQ